MAIISGGKSRFAVSMAKSPAGMGSGRGLVSGAGRVARRCPAWEARAAPGTVGADKQPAQPASAPEKAGTFRRGVTLASSSSLGGSGTIRVRTQLPFHGFFLCHPECPARLSGCPPDLPGSMSPNARRPWKLGLRSPGRCPQHMGSLSPVPHCEGPRWGKPGIHPGARSRHPPPRLRPRRGQDPC